MTENAKLDALIVTLTSDITAAHVSNNNVSVTEIAGLISSVHKALIEITKVEKPPVVQLEPAVPIKASVKHEYIVCLEDGKKLKMLKRHLRRYYKMTPDEYRAKWGLPVDYPMVAPAYTEVRKALALKSGLGRHK